MPYLLIILFVIFILFLIVLFQKGISKEILSKDKIPNLTNTVISDNKKYELIMYNDYAYDEAKLSWALLYANLLQIIKKKR